MTNQEKGKAGEDLAELYLISKGYSIIKRNYRCKFGEIDIIARKDNVMSFVEVKTRFSLKYGRGAEAVNKKKMEHIKRCAWSFVEKTNWQGDYRIEVIEITVQHLDQIFDD